MKAPAGVRPRGLFFLNIQPMAKPSKTVNTMNRINSQKNRISELKTIPVMPNPLPLPTVFDLTVPIMLKLSPSTEKIKQVNT